jgi:hypothetical protein
VKQDETSFSWLKGIICLPLQRNHISYKSLIKGVLMDQVKKALKKLLQSIGVKVPNFVVNKWPMAMRVLTGAQDNGMHGLSYGRRTVGIRKY